MTVVPPTSARQRWNSGDDENPFHGLTHSKQQSLRIHDFGLLLSTIELIHKPSKYEKNNESLSLSFRATTAATVLPTRCICSSIPHELFL